MVAKKIPLSGSTHGRGFRVSATDITSGNTLHTCLATTTAGLGDDVTLFAYNGHTSPLTLVLRLGTGDGENSQIEVPIGAKETVVAVPSWLGRNGHVLSAACSEADKIVVWGHAIRMEPPT